MKTYSTQVPGKWILAGEHAVLRGVPALVFPLRSRVLDLSYACSTGAKTLNLYLQGEHGEELQLLVWGVLERACEIKKISRASLVGELTLKSSIPVGAGMGASAALCVALTKWLHFLNVIKEEEMFEFARTLENLFHGESSGVDIAVSLSGQGLHYQRGGERRVLDLQWTPHWYISYSGKRGVTLECVNKVKELIAGNPELGSAIDGQMRTAVAMCEKALTDPDEAKSLELLKAGIESAGEVFERWGLTEGAPQTHMDMLKKAGAVAVKPTGSGGGGYVLSLWTAPPPDELLPKLIPC
jgi:mevalonate kinase